MGKREEKIQLTLEALLHDVGKFYQRTGDKLEEFYYLYTKDNSYLHGGFTAQFIDKYLESKYSDIKELSANHHTIPHSIIKTADIYASSHDRKSEPAMDDLDPRNYIRARLNSIFDIVCLDINSNRSSTYINLAKNSEHFPSKKLNFDSLNDCKKEYKELFDEMVNLIKEIKSKSKLELHHKLYPILKEYTNTIPSSTYKVEVPVIGLFDHSKLTAAIANCIDENKDHYDDQFMIIEYDMSGIQSFIFMITEGSETKEHLSKSLRTRSFYLNILCDFIAYSIINEFDLSYENVLYTSGGRGQVLIPYNEQTITKVENLIKKIVKVIYGIHKTDVSFAFNYAILNLNHFRSEKYGDLLYGEEKKSFVKKNQKYNHLFDEDFKFINESSNSECQLCGNNQKTKAGKCFLCNMLLDLNDKVLRNYDEFIVEFDYTGKSYKGIINLDFQDLGTIRFHEHVEEVNDYSYYISINSSILGETKFYPQSNITGINFEEISKMSEGDHKLAVIKMDVDNLGYIFGRGFQKKTSTFSKTLTLSREIDYFFTNQILKVCRKKNYDNGIYIIFSGGDDVAVVLPASKSLAFIKDVNQLFSEFIGGNEALHISSGIEIFHPSSPVRFAVLKAEEQLEIAKDNPDKNSFAVDDIAFKNTEIESLINQIEYYKDAVNDERISRTVIYNIYISLKLSLDNSENKKAFLRFIPQIAYTITRNVNDKEILEILKKTLIRSDIIENLDIIKKYKIIFSYVLMCTREDKNE